MQLHRLMLVCTLCVCVCVCECDEILASVTVSLCKLPELSQDGASQIYVTFIIICHLICSHFHCVFCLTLGQPWCKRVLFVSPADLVMGV